MTSKKIAVMIDRVIVGGVEKIAIEEVRALRLLGHDAQLVVLRRKALSVNAFSDMLHDIPITYLDDRLPRFLRFSFAVPFMKFFALFHVTYPFILPHYVKRDEFDSIFCHGTYTSFSAIRIAKKRKIQLATLVWDPLLYILDRVYSEFIPKPITSVARPILRQIDKYILRNGGEIILGSTAHEELVKTILPSCSPHVLYPGVHPIKKQQKKSDYILAVTAWKAGKNPEYFIEVAKELPEIPIKLAGKWIDPSYEKRYREQLRQSGLERQIQLLGEVTEEQLRDLYAHAALLLQTNFDPGFGMPALEAAAQATTFVIPKGQGVCALFTDGVDGFYTDEHDLSQITSYIYQLLTSTSLSLKMGESAWQKVRKRYSWEVHAREILSYYN